MKVTNPRINRLIDVVCKYSSKLLTLVAYTVPLIFKVQDKHPNTLILISIFIFLLNFKKVGLSGFYKAQWFSKCYISLN